jgi:hypothetical protein
MLVLAAGCVQEAPVAEPVVAADDPLPYIAEELEESEPILASAEIEAAVQEALGRAYSVNADPVLSAYAAAMEGAEAGCPDYYETEGNVYWYDACTASDGASYDGYAFYVVYEDYDSGDGMLYDGDALYGVGSVANAAGSTFQFGGSAYTLLATPADGSNVVVYYSVTSGAFAYDGAEGAGTWIDPGGAPDLVAYAADYFDYDARFAYLDGSLGLASTTPGVTAVVFDGLQQFSPELRPDCTEASGAASIRDADGGWYDVVFDGPADYEAEVDASLCDGCGTVYFHGEPVGQACVDTMNLVSWEDTPW